MGEAMKLSDSMAYNSAEEMMFGLRRSPWPQGEAWLSAADR
jgi:hypothetical protein